MELQCVPLEEAAFPQLRARARLEGTGCRREWPTEHSEECREALALVLVHAAEVLVPEMSKGRYAHARRDRWPSELLVRGPPQLMWSAAARRRPLVPWGSQRARRHSAAWPCSLGICTLAAFERCVQGAREYPRCVRETYCLNVRPRFKPRGWKSSNKSPCPACSHSARAA